jgi:hypothetical protein
MNEPTTLDELATEAWSFSLDEGIVNSACWSPDGALLASAQLFPGPSRRRRRETARLAVLQKSTLLTDFAGVSPFKDLRVANVTPSNRKPLGTNDEI